MIEKPTWLADFWVYHDEEIPYWEIDITRLFSEFHYESEDPYDASLGLITIRKYFRRYFIAFSEFIGNESEPKDMLEIVRYRKMLHSEFDGNEKFVLTQLFHKLEEHEYLFYFQLKDFWKNYDNAHRILSKGDMDG